MPSMVSHERHDLVFHKRCTCFFSKEIIDRNHFAAHCICMTSHKLCRDMQDRAKCRGGKGSESSN